MDTLVDRGWEDVDGDERTVAHLLSDQLEFADMLLLNKCDLVTAAQLGLSPDVLPTLYHAAQSAFAPQRALDGATLAQWSAAAPEGGGGLSWAAMFLSRSLR